MSEALECNAVDTPHEAHDWGFGSGESFRCPGMTTLADFLLARIAEDEERARAAAQGPWTWREYGGRNGVDPVPYLTGRGGDPATYAYDTEVIEPNHSGECGCRSSCTLELRVRVEDREHIARHDPARVLAECEAKRRIVARHDAHLGHEPTPHIVPRLKWREGCDTLRLLALPYADHPDFREEWRP